MKPSRLAPSLAILGLAALVTGCGDGASQASCEPNPCRESGRTRCEMDAGVARCLCDPGNVDVGGVCVSNAACLPNPCATQYQTTCIPQGETALCVCDPGHAPSGSGCDPFPIFDCSILHGTGSPDAFEPDECPDKATLLQLVPMWNDGHSLNPEGDVDWFWVIGTARHIYELRAVGTTSSGEVALYVDAYASDGVTSLGADHRGTPSASVWFRAPSNGRLYARIQAFRANAVGPYRVQVTDIGIDDFADLPAAALSIAPDMSVAGDLQFDGDRDVVKLPLRAGISYGLSFEFFGVGTPLVEVLAADGTTVIQKLAGAHLDTVTRPSADTAVFLRVSGLIANTLGQFTLKTATLGLDDHGDVPVEATAVVASESPISVSLDRAGDADVLSFDAVPSNIYSFDCGFAGGFGPIAVTLTDESGAVLEQISGSSSPSIVHEATYAGRRFIQVRGDFGSTPRLSCKLQNLGPDDHGDTIFDATPIAAGAGATAARLETDEDTDVFSFTAIKGHIYRFDCALSPNGSCYTRLLSSIGAEEITGSSVAWEATTAGTYYLEVSSYWGGLGGYLYTLTDLGLDDHGDTFATASALVPNALPQGASLEEPFDLDVFSYEALQGHIYRFTCTPSSGTGCTVRVFGPAGALIASYYSYSLEPAVVAYEVSAAGTYYVEASMGASSSWVGTDYTYSLEDLGVDDHGDDRFTASAVLPGDSGSAALEYPGDVDAFKFTPTAGRVYRLACTQGTVTRCDLALLNSAGMSLYSIASYYDGEILFEATSSDPLVFIVGYDFSYYYGPPQGTYVWSITDIGTDDHGDTLATATPAVLPMVAQSAQLESFDDVDVFSFSATVGRIYRAVCSRGTVSSCSGRVKDGAGKMLAQQSSYWSSNATFTPATSDTYYFEVLADTSYGEAVGTYSWVIEDLGPEDHGSTLDSATHIATGPPATEGNLSFSTDVDMFSFDAVAGRIYVATCNNSSGYACTATIESSTGKSLATGQTRVGYEATASEKLFVEIRNTYSGSAIGAYTLQVDDLGPDDHGDTYQTATALPGLGISVSGNIEIAGDVDYFSISLPASSPFTADVFGNYAELTVYAPNGAFLVSGTSARTFITASAGTYYVRISNWYYPGSNSTYTVRVR